MSLCRFSKDSDVYVFYISDTELECCGCMNYFCDNLLTGKDIMAVGDEEFMIKHLEHHKKFGDKVPNYVFERLKDAKRSKSE